MIRALEDDFKTVVGIRLVAILLPSPATHHWEEFAMLFSLVTFFLCFLQLVSLGICCHLLVSEC